MGYARRRLAARACAEAGSYASGLMDEAHEPRHGGGERTAADPYPAPDASLSEVNGYAYGTALGALRVARRVAVTVIGSTVVAIGVAMLVLPGPGLLVIPAGLGILGLEFAFARRWLAHLRARAADVAAKVSATVTSASDPDDDDAKDEEKRE
jgi:hypothetical protein